MNVLLLAPWLPWPAHDGGRIRLLETVRHLGRKHRVTLVAGVRNEGGAAAAEMLQKFCARVETAVISDRPLVVAQRLAKAVLAGRPWVQAFHYSSSLFRRVKHLTESEAFDVVHVEFPFLAPYIRAISKASAARTVLGTQNIESQRLEQEPARASSLGRRVAVAWDRRFFPRWEAQAIGAFDGVAVVSESDRRWVERHVPESRVELVPNGVDTDAFQPPVVPVETSAIVFTGHMGYPPNVDGALWFADTIWPSIQRSYPGLRLQIVGRSPHPRVQALAVRGGIEVTGEVPDVRPYLSRARVVVVPLRAGGGTRLKILEAMAMARPVVATTLGAEGLEVTDGENIVLADSAGAFVNRLDMVLRSPETQARLAEGGRRLTVNRYEWRMCLAELEHLYESLVVGPSAASITRS